MEEFDFKRQSIPHFRLPPALVFKWGAPALEEGFIAFPKKLLRRLTEFLSAEDPLTELALLLALADYARDRATRSPSFEFLSFVTDIPVEKLEEAAESLVERELIEAQVTQGHLNFSLSPIQKKLAEEI